MEHFASPQHYFCRDLKTANVLVSRALRAKISDFGSIKDVLQKSGNRHSKFTGEIMEHLFATEQEDSAQLMMMATAGVGTPSYMAPEVMGGLDYDNKADVFSFGIILWEIATQQSPDLIQQELGAYGLHSPIRQLIQLLVQGRRLSFPPDGS